MNKRKYLIMLVLSVITLSLSGCGSQEETGSDGVATVEEGNQVAENTSDGDETVDTNSGEEVQETELNTETDTTEEVIESDVEVESDITYVDTESDVEANAESIEDPEVPEAEMVDFETWAKQEGNDEVCLVVWNEELGIQEVIPPFQEKQEIRGINEGDKFAIPYNEKIRAVMVNDEDVTPPLIDYREVSVMTGGQIVIIFENEQGELQTINYLF